MKHDNFHDERYVMSHPDPSGPHLVLAYSELRKLLHPVIPHAAKGGQSVPVLTRVAITSSGGVVFAQATNRFTAGFQRVRPAQSPGVFDMQVEAEAARRLLNLLRPSGGSDPTVILAGKPDGGLTATSASGALALGFDDVSLSFPAATLDGGAEFPDLRALLSKTAVGDALVETSVDLTLVSLFRAATDVNRAINTRSGIQPVRMRLSTKPNGPLFITVGPDFLGLVMPRRDLDEATVTERLDVWRDALPQAGRARIAVTA